MSERGKAEVVGILGCRSEKITEAEMVVNVVLSNDGARMRGIKLEVRDEPKREIFSGQR